MKKYNFERGRIETENLSGAEIKEKEKTLWKLLSVTSKIGTIWCFYDPKQKKSVEELKIICRSKGLK